MTAKRATPAARPNSRAKKSAAVPAKTGTDPLEGERIAKRIARAGLCSRREAERWIAEGRVTLNGETVATPATTVKPDDILAVDGKVIAAPERARLWRYHKKRGIVSSPVDRLGRPTIVSQLPPGMPRIIPVAALDPAAEGLMLLTNDGQLARQLDLPQLGWVRRYRVRVFGDVDEAKLAALAKGITVEGVHYDGIEAKLDKRSGANAWLTVALREGRKRDVRSVMEHIGLKVNRLIRVSFGPFQLGNLEEGAASEVPKKVIADQMGGVFAAPASSPVHGEKQSDEDHGGKA